MIDTHTDPATVTRGQQVAIVLLSRKYSNRFLGIKNWFSSKMNGSIMFLVRKMILVPIFSWNLDHLWNLSIGRLDATCKWPATHRWPPVAMTGPEFVLKCSKANFSNWNKSWRAADFKYFKIFVQGNLPPLSLRRAPFRRFQIVGNKIIFIVSFGRVLLSFDMSKRKWVC